MIVLKKTLYEVIQILASGKHYSFICEVWTWKRN